MASILVVCTGNVCRSPIAEGVLRSLLEDRFGDRSPSVASAGTAGWAGSPADPGSVAAAAELGVDISEHRGRLLTPAQLDESALVLAMAAEHRTAVGRSRPEVGDRTFTLKELVRLLERLPVPVGTGVPDDALATRAVEANTLRRNGFKGNRRDEDVEDPLGLPLPAFRAVAIEIEEWCGRLARGLFGPVPARAEAEGA